VCISAIRQISNTTSLRPLIRPIVNRPRAALWSSDQKDLLRHRRLQEDCASILPNNTCPRLSLPPALYPVVCASFTFPTSSGSAHTDNLLAPCTVIYIPPRIRLPARPLCFSRFGPLTTASLTRGLTGSSS